MSNPRKPEPEEKRDDKGRFTKGCCPGPGRPRKRRKPTGPTLSATKIWMIAQQWKMRSEMLDRIKQDCPDELYQMITALIARSDAFDLDMERPE